MVTVLTGEVAPRVQSEEEGDLLEWCERGAGEGVGKEEGEAEMTGLHRGQARIMWRSSPRVLGGSGGSGGVGRERACE